MKKFSIIFIIIFLAAFITFEICRKAENTVLKVLRPNVLQIDLNNNNLIDDNETICVANLETFTSNLLISQEDLAKQHNLSIEDAIAMGYLTDNYAEKFIINKNVKLKFNDKMTPECRYAEVYLNGENYAQKLYQEGYGIYQEKVSEKFLKNIEHAKKLKLVILNHHSNKYHKLNCKYGLVAHDTVVVYKKELPKDAKPCKFCHLEPQKSKSSASNEKTLPAITPPPAQITSGSIKFILTDLTTTLKPSKKCTSSVCRTVLSELNTAKSTIDIAIYGFETVPEIETALKNALARGVKIRLVYDDSENGKNYYPDTYKITAMASVSKSDKNTTSTNMLMHNKFIIIDNSKVLTGSMNYSPTGLSGFNSNNFILINSKDIANLYTEEFNQMISGKFHTAKAKSNLARTYIMGSGKISVYFSPQDRVITNNIIPLVSNSSKYIYIPAFIVTHGELVNALITAHNRGVDVKLIIDATNASSAHSAVKKLRTAGISVKVENYAGKMHNKSIIIDNKYIVTGSMNFSNSGEKKNDENVLIIEDTRLAIFYRNFFNYIWQKIPDKYLKQNVRAEGKNSIGSCSDGVDNNFDGKIDMEDAGCK